MARFLSQREVGPWQERIAREELSPARPSTATGGASSVASRRSNPALNAANLRALETQPAAAPAAAAAVPLPPHRTLAKDFLQDQPGAFRVRFGRRPGPPRPSRQPPAAAPGVPLTRLGTPAASHEALAKAAEEAEARRQRRQDKIDAEERASQQLTTSSSAYGRGAVASATSFAPATGGGGGSTAEHERRLREQARLHEELVANRAAYRQPPSVRSTNGAASTKDNRGGVASSGSRPRTGGVAFATGNATDTGDDDDAAALAAQMEQRVRMLEAHIAAERDSSAEVKERLERLTSLLEQQQQRQARAAATPPGSAAQRTRFAATKRLPSRGGGGAGKPPLPTPPVRPAMPREPARAEPMVVDASGRASKGRGSDASGGISSSAAKLSSRHLTW